MEEWDKIKTDEKLIRANIDKYLANVQPGLDDQDSFARKRTYSSDDEKQYQDPLFDPNFVQPVVPTFSRRGLYETINEGEDPAQPWVIRGMEKARARVEAHLAKIEAKRLAKETRVKTPAQEAIAAEIVEIGERIANLIQVKNMGMSTEETNLTLKKLIRQKKERATELSLLKSKQRAGLRYRQRRKKHLENLCSADPEVATELLKLYKPSTLAVHSIDNTSPDLLQTIEEIARIGGVSTKDSRCLNSNEPCGSLDELRERIKERGYEIRRSSIFYR